MSASDLGDLKPGSQVGHFEVVCLIGAGGMGVVYRARDILLGRDVALKVISPALLPQDSARLRFIREAQLGAAIVHPNVATVYEIGAFQGTPYIAMEFVAGETLKERLSTGPLPLKDVVSLGCQVCDALEAAHNQGVVHRDIKPANIILDDGGRAKILDFGLAKAFAEASSVANADPSSAGQTPARDVAGVNTAQSVMAGTPGYMSPEQVQGSRVGPRSDLFALGIVLYEAASGLPPFEGAVDRDVLQAILSSEPTPLHEYPFRLPKSFSRCVSKCLAKRPKERYPSAAALRSDLAGARPPALRDSPLLTRRSALAIAAGAVLAAGFWVVSTRKPPDHSLLPRSVAILPLKNLSADPNHEYFSDGITAEIVAQLAKIGDLSPISERSVMRYKDSDKDIADIGRELHAENIVDGSVRVSGNRVRVIASFVNTSSGQPIWSETYDAMISDILEIQSDLARRIVQSVLGTLSPTHYRQLEAKPPRERETYVLYLKGRYLLSKRTEQGFDAAIESFERAIEREKTYAPPYAGLAEALIVRLSVGLDPDDTRAVEERAARAATTAVELDETLAPAHASLAFLKWRALNWVGAKASYERAMELNPGYATVHHWFALYLACLGRFDAALESARRARELDPYSGPAAANPGVIRYLARDYDASIRELEPVLVSAPELSATYKYLAAARLMNGDFDEALSIAERAAGLFPGDPEIRAELAYIYATVGRRVEANTLLQELIARDSGARGLEGSIAVIYAALGDSNTAFEWLERAFSAHDPWFMYLNVEPRLDRLRADPRFTGLMRRAGLATP